MAKFEELPIEIQEVFIASYEEMRRNKERKKEILAEEKALDNKVCKSGDERRERDERLLELSNESVSLSCKDICAVSRVYSAIEKMFNEN